MRAKKLMFPKTKVKSVQLGCLLKLSIFVVQKAAAQKNGVEFCQRSIGAIRCSLAMPYDDVRQCSTFNQSEVFGGG